MLHVTDDNVDWWVFQQQVSQAGALRAGDSLEAALERYDSALALWRGEPLLMVPGPGAALERDAMYALRLDAWEARLRTLADMGRFEQVTAEAAALVEQHPLREGLHELLIESLYRARRPADAARAYERVTRLLNERLGTAPGAPLRDLYAEIARRPGAGSGAVHQRAAVPRQLPHSVADFTGRAVETARIRRALVPNSSSSAPVVVITGMGGSGKTTLAMHSLQPVLAHYPDGQLYSDLRGADGEPADTGPVLSSLLRSLGQVDDSIPDDLDERAELYRDLMSNRRALIVLDNAADVHQVLPLLPASPSCAVVVTSRDSMATLPVAVRIALGPLPAEEALLLLERLIGGARVEAEPYASRHVLAACGGLPLAIRIIGSRLAARPSWTVAEIADRLADERRRLSEMQVESVAVEASFALGYAQLDEDTRRAFRLLAVPAQSGFDAERASMVLAAPEGRVRQALEQLVGAGLLESPAWNRFRYHDLVLLFAQRLSAETDTPAERHLVLERLLDVHLVMATDSYHFLLPGHTLPRATLPAVAENPRFIDEAAVVAWASASLSDIFRLLSQTAASHSDQAATLLLMLDPVITNFHRHHESAPIATAVADAAAAQGDQRTEGRARYMLAGALTQMGRITEAQPHAVRALEAARSVDDGDVHVMAANVHGLIVGWSDASAGARLHLDAADLARRQGNPASEAVALGNAVQERLRLDGVDEETVAASRRQLTLHQQNRDRLGEAIGHYRHGQVLLRQGQVDEAVTSHERTLTLLREGEQDYIRAASHLRLAQAHLQAKRAEPALQHAELARTMAQQVRHVQLAAISLTTLGDALSALHRETEARSYWQDAVDELSNLGYDIEVERALKRLTSNSTAE
ncbi:BTAD domain-containing putative transcriptional regulator [Streptomyces sp. NPDC013433]|uniref:BTAD domain-containing putative transcriptional regulator n=1 Tax=Streptomyces sp. NPDC013433 TaxID=3155604 RepID=UPI0034547B15